MSFVDLSKYIPLSQYAVLAGTGITAGTATTPTVVYNGFWGTSSSVNKGAIYAGGVYPNGEKNNPYATTAQEQLCYFSNELYSYTMTLQLTAIKTSYCNQDITFYPNINYASSTVASFNSSNLIFDAQGDSNAQFFITVYTDLILNTCSIHLINGAKACNVFWLSTQGCISFSCVGDIAGIIVASTSVTFNQTNEIDGHVYAKEGVTFSGSCTRIYSTTCCPVCYAEGTQILTINGFISIENLQIGDRVLTKGKIECGKVKDVGVYKFEPVVWVSSFQVKNLSTNSLPICITQHTLGKNMPMDDLYVSPDHGIVVNGKLVPAKKMVNGSTVFQDTTCLDIKYYHLELENHSVINANGLFAESYLECGNNRKMFKPTHSLKTYLKPARNIQMLK